LVPVIRDVAGKTLRQISDEVRGLAQKARDGTLTLDELDHPTFTVTSLGAVGIDFFTPIINPPNVAILGVGGLKDGVVWEGDRPLRSRILTLSLTIDHRVIDGEPGALFLREVKELLESPFMLLS
jgi:pyruvate dehydrogenase E2 component (dihydrolipoamide acetyltransferase)